jgi:hypothetical protein
MLSDDNEFLRWTKYLDDDREQERAFSVRTAHLTGFKSYYIPCIVLPKKTSLAALAKIFETLNRTGVRLDVFDLMVAKLYPRGFHLRDEWTNVVEVSPELKEFDVNGIEILKLIALGEHLLSVTRDKRLPSEGCERAMYSISIRK